MQSHARAHHRALVALAAVLLLLLLLLVLAAAPAHAKGGTYTNGTWKSNKPVGRETVMTFTAAAFAGVARGAGVLACASGTTRTHVRMQACVQPSARAGLYARCDSVLSCGRVPAASPAAALRLCRSCVQGPLLAPRWPLTPRQSATARASTATRPFAQT